ncbi:adenosylcobinamide kinase/adenosylcobinamide phosphate guanyltransferase [Enemella evansiae]|nr:adenosylcobinamide kinase/adenosylcobinamide phosphate guanyltransferase [Enemella evansiae]
MGAVRVLITGGIRSGKSRTAEETLSGQDNVVYLAPGPKADPVTDPEWAERIAHHQEQRPAHWRTIETTEVAAALPMLDGPVLLDCLGTWLAAQLGETGAWDSLSGWESAIAERIEALAAAWRAYPHQAVAVTNEVGWGLVSDHRSGRIFTDWLGRTNQAIGAASDEVWLVVAGRTLKLT